MPNKTMLRVLFGSHIYGTNTPSSDRDYKSIFIPDGRELVLQKPSKHILNNTKTDQRQRNTAEDIDDEAFSFQMYMKLLLEGQTAALDILFTPAVYHQQDINKWWLEVLHHKDSFIHSGTSSFVGYCKTQAAKYGLKGGRVAALRTTLDYLKAVPNDRTKLFELGAETLAALVQSIGDEAEIINIKNPANVDEPHLMVCNRKVAFHCTVHYAIEVFQKIFDNYGQRALAAEKNEGCDWKALMHAVRVASEAEELLLTGKITFPRPEVDILRKIRLGPDNGGYVYREVEEMIEQGLVRVEEAKAKSTLRAHPDYKLADDIIEAVHLDAIKEHYGR